MKKNIIAIAVLLNCTLLMAQTEFDALKFFQTDLNGTSRYMSMAGAFGALGGDASAIKDNPAGLGIYRSSEITGTFNFLLQNNKSNWSGVTSNDNLFNLGFNNFAYVKATPTFRSQNGKSGLLSSNWSFSFNRLKSFDKNSTIRTTNSPSSMTDYIAAFTYGIGEADLQTANDPYNNTNVPWISILAYQGYLINPVSASSSWTPLLKANETLTPYFNIAERGSLDEYSIGWSGNFSNQVYFGATINLKTLNYTATTLYSEDFNSYGGMSLKNSISTTGSGFNFNLGLIVRPTDMLRLGLAFHSPTLYSLSDNYTSSLNYNVKDLNGAIQNNSLYTPDGAYNDFALLEPIQLNLSAAIIIGKKGLISAEYVYNNYMGGKLMDNNFNTQSFINENNRMKTNINDAATVKIGGEYKLNDNFSLRAGYAYITNATSPSNAYKQMFDKTVRTDPEYFLNNSTNYITAGFGYREANWYIDFAYVNKNLNETFYPYDSSYLAVGYKASQANVFTTDNNFVFTVGLKF
jgi:hypothetical protein